MIKLCYTYHTPIIWSHYFTLFHARIICADAKSETLCLPHHVTPRQPYHAMPRQCHTCHVQILGTKSNTAIAAIVPCRPPAPPAATTAAAALVEAGEGEAESGAVVEEAGSSGQQAEGVQLLVCTRGGRIKRTPLTATFFRGRQPCSMIKVGGGGEGEREGLLVRGGAMVEWGRRGGGEGGIAG